MNRPEYIEQHFLNIRLDKETMDVYVPRKAILAAVTACMSLFKGKLLDIGCGQMPYREMMLAANSKLEKYIGLDLRVSDIHNSGIADLFWDGDKIPMEDNSVDTAIATEVLEHSFYPTATLTEINRVIKPGGLFFFTVPFLWPLHETPYDAYRYTPFSLKKHLEEASFTAIEIHSLGGWHSSFAQMMGLWASESNLKGVRKKLIAKLVCRLIPYLLKNDIKDDRFGQHCMVSGLYGTAIKKQVS